MRYSPLTLKWCLARYLHGKKSYEKFREMFPIPSGSHLQRFVSWIPKDGGCHDCVLHEAKLAVTQLNLGTWGMDYLLCFDAMRMRKGLPAPLPRARTHTHTHTHARAHTHTHSGR
jgi:hypothetical protein